MMIFSLIYSIGFGIGLLMILTANSPYETKKQEQLRKNYSYANFLVVTIPRFIAFWVAYCSNNNEEKISTSVRWCLVVTYCVTMGISLFFTGYLGYKLAYYYPNKDSFWIYSGITLF